MINRPSPKIIGTIYASCIFFVLFFAGMMYLSKLGYIENVNDPWVVSLTSNVNEIVLSGSEIASVAIQVENLGTETLDSTTATNAVFLSFHVLTEEGKNIKHDNDRFAFYEPIKKNQQRTVAAVFDNTKMKLEPGKYIIEFDLVKEGEFWFAEKENKTMKIPMTLNGETE